MTEGSLAMACLMVAAALPVGCNKSQADVDASINSAIQEMMVKRTPQQQAIEALQTENADERRQLIRKVLKDKLATSDWAVTIFTLVAKTDPDPQVRCMAIKGLRRSADERAAEPLLMILNFKDFPQKVKPAPAEVRWDATEVISYMSGLGGIPEEHREWARRTLIRLVTDDPDRNVRICAAQALGYYQPDSVLTALIRALEDRDFAVRYAAENSLEMLTGERHDYNPDAWREWQRKNRSPVVSAGQPDPAGSPEGPAPQQANP